MSELATDAEAELPDPSPALPEKPGLTWRDLAADLWYDRPAFCGALFIGLLLATALFVGEIAPYDPAVQSLRERLRPPAWMDGGSWAHILGTDGLGRDMLSRVIFGSRISLSVGGLVVLVAGTVGVTIGLGAGYAGGRTDRILTRLVEINVAFPGLLLVLIILAVVGPSLMTVVVSLSFTGWMVYATITRSIVRSVRHKPYVEAARMVGCRTGRILVRHILPNLASPLLTLGILEFARIVLAEAALSFLGLGIQPPATSWGLDVAQGKEYLFRAWWLVTFPGLAIAATVLAVNLLASWARVTFDPQAREKRFAERYFRQLQRAAARSGEAAP